MPTDTSLNKSHGDDESERSQKLTNADFRKLLMTPRNTNATASSVLASSSSSSSFNKPQEILKTIPKSGHEDRAEQRRKKKVYYANLKKQEDDKIAELAEKYRDRAKERREGQGEDLNKDEENMTSASGYRAVAPDLKSGMDAAERRKQMIQESKYLGGDMEHTHLVKGLDYALLEKVKSEIQMKESEQEEEMERIVSAVRPKGGKQDRNKEEEEVQFRTRFAKNVYKMALGSREVERNLKFVPGRMAYVIELHDENAGDSDIPTTLIRSKADVPNMEQKPMMTTNDIVINKLAEILSYLRLGNKHGRKARRRERMQANDETIYPDAGDYVPSLEKHHTGERKKGNYFGDTAEKSSNVDDSHGGERSRASYRDRLVDEGRHRSSGDSRVSKGGDAASSSRQHGRNRHDRQENGKAGGVLNRLTAEPTGYAECYPGLEEMQDAIEDSDDEVDYTKMDLGNKKGPVGRWDFDTQEEYNTYMSHKEALPKAVYQYGLKMADGRRTRKFNKEKNERAELDREWNQIQNIMHNQQPKRKGGADDEAGHTKKPRH